MTHSLSEWYDEIQHIEHRLQWNIFKQYKIHIRDKSLQTINLI